MFPHLNLRMVLAALLVTLLAAGYVYYVCQSTPHLAGVTSTTVTQELTVTYLTSSTVTHTTIITYTATEIERVTTTVTVTQTSIRTMTSVVTETRTATPKPDPLRTYLKNKGWLSEY